MCQPSSERFAITTYISIGDRDRAMIDFPDARGKVQVRFDRDSGHLSWADSKFGNALMFVTASPKIIWTRIPQTLGETQVLFGECREAP